jgi:multicomponent K+:H+ antiporter subunit G
MSHLANVPIWAAIPAAVLVLVGAAITLIGSFGLLRLPSFYDRLHAPTLGTSWGTMGVMLAAVMVFSFAGKLLLVQELVIGIFIMLTTPVTMMLLGRATLYRDRNEAAQSQKAASQSPPAAKEDPLG